MSLLQRTIKLVLATCLAAWLADFFRSILLNFSRNYCHPQRDRYPPQYCKASWQSLFIYPAGSGYRKPGFSLSRFSSRSIGHLYRALCTSGLSAWLGNRHYPQYRPGHPSALRKSTSWSLLGNELALFLIGTGFALLANLYMPSRQQEIDSYHEQVEEQLKKDFATL